MSDLITCPKCRKKTVITKTVDGGIAHLECSDAGCDFKQHRQTALDASGLVTAKIEECDC